MDPRFKELSEKMELLNSHVEKTSYELKEIKKSVIRLEKLSKENYERISSQEKNNQGVKAAVFYTLVGGAIMFAILLFLSYLG